MHARLKPLIPSFVKRARRSEYLADTFAAVRHVCNTASCPNTSGRKSTGHPCSITTTPPKRKSSRPFSTLIRNSRWHSSVNCVRTFTDRTAPTDYLTNISNVVAIDVINLDARSNTSHYTFDIVGNLGLYRDLQRHRILTQERQDFTTRHGYDTPVEIEEAGFQPDFARCMDQAADLLRTARARFSAGSAVCRSICVSCPLVHENEPARSGAYR